MIKKALEFKGLKPLGRRLQKLRMKSGLSARAVGRELGVAGTTITRWENGEIEPRLAYIIYWIEKHEADPYWLLFGVE